MSRAARSLDTALAQLNGIAPRRSKASDGGKASKSHSVANPTSDHEPDANDIYWARDFTHDPANGADMSRLPMALMADSRAKYVIFDDWFYDRTSNGGIRKRPYKEVNPRRTNKHDKHLHLSVNKSNGEDIRQWGAFITGGTTPPPPPVRGAESLPTLTHGMRGNTSVLSLQRFMTSRFPGYNKYSPSGNYLDMTAAGLAEFQHRVGITGPDANGRTVGPRTKQALWAAGWRG